MNHFKKKFDYLNSVGTTFGSLTKDDLHTLEVSYPPRKILEKFESVVSVYDAKIKSNSKQNQELVQLRDWLLPMLMNGQVKVAEIEEYALGTVQTQMAAEPKLEYLKDDRFKLWLSTQQLAARGEIDEETLRVLFDAMDENEQ